MKKIIIKILVAIVVSLLFWNFIIVGTPVEKVIKKGWNTILAWGEDEDDGDKDNGDQEPVKITVSVSTTYKGSSDSTGYIAGSDTINRNPEASCESKYKKCTVSSNIDFVVNWGIPFHEWTTTYAKTVNEINKRLKIYFETETENIDEINILLPEIKIINSSLAKGTSLTTQTKWEIKKQRPYWMGTPTLSIDLEGTARRALYKIIDDWEEIEDPVYWDNINNQFDYFSIIPEEHQEILKKEKEKRKLRKYNNLIKDYKTSLNIIMNQVSVFYPNGGEVRPLHEVIFIRNEELKSFDMKTKTLKLKINFIIPATDQTVGEDTITIEYIGDKWT